MSCKYPLFWNALGTVVAVGMIALIPDTTVRVIVCGLWYLQLMWLWWAVIGKKPPLSSKQRRAMMCYFIDHGLELARSDEERDILVTWISAQLQHD